MQCNTLSRSSHSDAVGKAGACRSCRPQAAVMSKCTTWQCMWPAPQPQVCRCQLRCDRLERGRERHTAHHNRSCEAKQQEVAMGLGGQQVELYEPCDCKQGDQRIFSATSTRT